MQTALECVPCFARQALEAARVVTDDPVVHERLLRDVLRTAAEMDLSQCPPVVAQRIHRTLRELTGVADPYRADRERFNRVALDLMGELTRLVRRAADPFATALRVAIAGNVIDLGVNGTITEAEILASIRRVMDEPFHGDVDAIRDAVGRAERILYLADNAGEIVFDRLLIEQLPPGRVTVAVRGGPILNDATRADADVAGLAEVAEVIDNGSDAPGTVLGDCSETFREHYDRADLVIAKGQGNFETLSDEDASIYFLLKAKCPVIADHVGLPIGTLIVMPWGPWAAGAVQGRGHGTNAAAG
ncbi:MAG: damage-control phosphatase ARMT1 family protein [Planctomycetota bacterium]